MILYLNFYLIFINFAEGGGDVTVYLCLRSVRLWLLMTWRCQWVELNCAQVEKSLKHSVFRFERIPKFDSNIR